MNVCFCSKCDQEVGYKKLEKYGVAYTDFPELRVSFKKVYGECSVCGNEVYSRVLLDENIDRFEKARGQV